MSSSKKAAKTAKAKAKTQSMARSSKDKVKTGSAGKAKAEVDKKAKLKAATAQKEKAVGKPAGKIVTTKLAVKPATVKSALKPTTGKTPVEGKANKSAGKTVKAAAEQGLKPVAVKKPAAPPKAQENKTTIVKKAQQAKEVAPAPKAPAKVASPSAAKSAAAPVVAAKPAVKAAAPAKVEKPVEVKAAAKLAPKAAVKAAPAKAEVPKVEMAKAEVVKPAAAAKPIVAPVAAAKPVAAKSAAKPAAAPVPPVAAKKVEAVAAVKPAVVSGAAPGAVAGAPPRPVGTPMGQRPPGLPPGRFGASRMPFPPIVKPVDPRVAANGGKAPGSSKTGFKTNEYIVYPAHGVGQIIATEEQEVAGHKLELYVISFFKDKLTLKVPLPKVLSGAIRKLSDAPTVQKSLDTLTGRARIKRTMWSRRAQEYEAKINSGDLVAIAEVVRDLYRSEAQPEQSYSERQLYEAALDRMAREVGVVQKLTETESLKVIEQHLEKGPRRGARTEAAADGEADSDSEGEIEAAA